MRMRVGKFGVFCEGGGMGDWCAGVIHCGPEGHCLGFADGMHQVPPERGQEQAGAGVHLRFVPASGEIVSGGMLAREGTNEGVREGGGSRPPGHVLEAGVLERVLLRKGLRVLGSDPAVVRSRGPFRVPTVMFGANLAQSRRIYGAFLRCMRRIGREVVLFVVRRALTVGGYVQLDAECSLLC